ncbi:hypothetical protein HG531_001487 [Fusarium graminearum]|nr:hypothetical protein HG531_001487 [Fusarium graminearum]
MIDPSAQEGRNISTLASKVPSCRVEQLRGQVDHRDLSDVISGTTNTSAQSAETDGRCLGDDGVRDGSKTSSVNEGDQYAEDSLGVIGGAVLVDGGDDTEEEEEGNIVGSFDEIEKGRASTKLLLNLNSSLHHGKLLVRVLLVFAAETLNGSQSFVFAALSDKPPG